jgi:O-antigen/teichoic acid export membrane protein
MIMDGSKMLANVDPHDRPTAVSSPLRERVLSAGVWVTAGFVLDKLIAAGQMAILARLLAPVDFGLMALSATVLVALLTLSELGVETALVSRGEPGPEDLQVAWTLSVARGLALAVCVWLFADFVAAFFRTADLAALLRVHAFALLLQGAQSPALAVLLRDLDLSRRVKLDLTRRLVETVATIALAVWLRSAWALLWGQVLSFTVGCLLSHRIAPSPLRLSLDRQALARFTRSVKYVNATTIFIFCVTSGGEFVIGRLQGAEALGFYQVALTLPVLLGTRVAILMHQVSFPAYAKLRNDRAGLVRAFSFQMGLAGAIVLPVACGIALLAPEVVTVVFGPRWAETIVPLRALCLFSVCAGLSGVMASLHYGMDRPEIQRRIWAVQFVMYAATIVPLTERLGVLGAASALTASYGLGLLLHALYTYRLLGTGVRPAAVALARAALVVGAIATLWLVMRTLKPDPPDARVLALGATGAAGLYLLYLWWIEVPRLRRLWKGSSQKERHGW